MVSILITGNAVVFYYFHRPNSIQHHLLNKAELYKSLYGENHSREKRIELARRILRSENLVAPLLDLAFNRKDPVSIKSCMVLEFTVKERVASLHPYIDHFTRKIRNVRNESAIRPLSKTCEYLLIDYFIHTDGTTQAVLTRENLERIAAVCFDWLIGDHKVAAKVYAMDCLLLLGRKFDWIHSELWYVLDQNYNSESAAYKTRARFVFSQMKKKV